jgi:hypothetical protein
VLPNPASYLGSVETMKYSVRRPELCSFRRGTRQGWEKDKETIYKLQALTHIQSLVHATSLAVSEARKNSGELLDNAVGGGGSRKRSCWTGKRRGACQAFEPDV